MRRCFVLLSMVVTLLCVSKVRAEPIQWVSVVKSPQSAPPNARDAALYKVCGARDLGLVRVAAAVVTRRVEDAPPPSDRQMRTLMHAAGVPHLWPRAWALRGNHRPSVVIDRMSQWLAKRSLRGIRRCGIARGSDGAGRPVVVAITVDALADLAPLAIKVPVSRWTKLEAAIHVPADGVKVVLLGPRGRPKRVLASLSDGRVRSRFSLDSKGQWKIQVVALTASGPLPVLETLLFAGVDPPDELADHAAAPAEQSPSPKKLYRLLNESRRAEGMPALTRDRELDKLARQHARGMMTTRRVAHDLGKGTPDERARNGGVSAHHVGENVASAPSVARVHHALWDSPSHRENMLDASFRRVGVALAISREGQLYAVQMFAD